MADRPRAKYDPDTHGTPQGEVPGAQVLEELMHKRDQRVQAVLVLLRDLDNIYYLHVIEATGCTYPQAQSTLKYMEREKMLVSELQPSPISGLGRRHYKLARRS